jgi:hypothetical protein
MEYKSGEGLLVSKKTEALLNKIYPTLVNFPKAEKFALCHEIKQNFYDLIKFIEMANSVKSKRKVYAQEADGHLQTLKVLFRLSRNRRYISQGFYREIDTRLTEINKLLSGFIRSA